MLSKLFKLLNFKTMAKTPVKLEIDGYKEREVLMVTYEFDQATDI